MITVIAACSNNRVIGRDGDLPWRLPTDMRRFRELTTGHTVVMGRRTWESLPASQRPLPNRRNIVVTSDPASLRATNPEGVEAYPSLDAALAAAGDDCFVIGGERVYRDAMARATRLHLTHVDVECDGDAFFPEFDTAEWECVEASDPVVENGHTYVFRTYDRLPSLYLHAAARSDAQAQHMADLEAARVCIFCPEHVGAYAREPVEVEGEHWYVKKNDYPYDGASAHYLIVARRHVRSFDELPDEAGAELWAIKRKLRAQLDPLAIATVERSGDMRYNGGSVAHLHVHFVALDAIPGTPVRFRVSGHATGDAETPPTSSPGSET